MKTAVVLVSMGGPDALQAVRPFLFNLFNDPAIIRLPSFPRWVLAQALSFWRAKTARKIYEQLGGRSPLLANTLSQAEALEAVLKQKGDYRCFVGMSYWHPFIKETMRGVKEFSPDRIIILPMYPQFSTTTTLSVKRDAKKAAHETGLDCESIVIENFHRNDGFILALAENIKEQWDKAHRFGAPLVLFSAHGLPQKIVDKGDPYPHQCKETARALAQSLNLTPDQWVLCYQSRVGPAKWIGPATESVIEEAAKKNRPLIIVPIAFVCEHSETLVECGIEYAQKARCCGAPFYAVTSTVGIKKAFIQGLAERIWDIN